MKINESIDMKGKLRIQVKDRAGQILRDFTTPNAIVNSGRDLVAQMFKDGISRPVNQIAVGTGTDAPTPADPGLGAELFRKEIEQSSIAEPDEDNRIKVTVSTTLALDEANGALSEAGLFSPDPNDPSQPGIMYNRVQFDTITKTNEFQLTLVWEIVF